MNFIKEPQSKIYLASILIFVALMYNYHNDYIMSLKLTMGQIIIAVCLILAITYLLEKYSPQYSELSWIYVAIVILSQLYTLHTLKKLKF
jgi:putative exporter of polyketide antibiotics